MAFSGSAHHLKTFFLSYLFFLQLSHATGQYTRTSACTSSRTCVSRHPLPLEAGAIRPGLPVHILGTACTRLRQNSIPKGGCIQVCSPLFSSSVMSNTQLNIWHTLEAQRTEGEGCGEQVCLCGSGLQGAALWGLHQLRRLPYVGRQVRPLPRLPNRHSHHTSPHSYLVNGVLAPPFPKCSMAVSVSWLLFDGLLQGGLGGASRRVAVLTPRAEMSLKRPRRWLHRLWLQYPSVMVKDECAPQTF